jgi:hypothetical protein
VTSQAIFACHMAFVSRLALPLLSHRTSDAQWISCPISVGCWAILTARRSRRSYNGNWLLLPEAMTSDILNSRYCLFFWSTMSSLCTTLPTATVKEPRINTFQQPVMPARNRQRSHSQDAKVELTQLQPHPLAAQQRASLPLPRHLQLRLEAVHSLSRSA